ncbi:MAG: hypothetical protein ACYC6N_28115 [Pirellulaceae bacterium]
MPLLHHKQGKTWGDVLLILGFVLFVSASAVLAAGEPPSYGNDAADGRRLILLYGDKQVDLRPPQPPKIAEPPVWRESPGLPRYRELNPPLPSGADRDSSWVTPMGSSSRESREHLEFIDPAEQRERRFLNVLRPTDVPVTRVTRLPPPDTDSLLASPTVPTATPPSSEPSTAVTGSISTTEIPPSAQAQRTPQSGDARRVSGPVRPTFSPAPSLDWYERRLTWLVIALLCTVLCLIVVVFQLLTAMGRFTSKLVPTIRLEMTSAGQIAASAAYEVDVPAGDGPAEPDKRAGAVVDFADQDIPAELFEGGFEKQRQAELERRKQQEQAILKDIFQDNLALRQRIRTQAI